VLSSGLVVPVATGGQYVAGAVGGLQTALSIKFSAPGGLTHANQAQYDDVSYQPLKDVLLVMDWSWGVYKGTYAAGTAYVVGQSVSYLGSDYICIQNCTNQTPVVGGTAYWTLITSLTSVTTLYDVANNVESHWAMGMHGTLYNLLLDGNGLPIANVDSVGGIATTPCLECVAILPPNIFTPIVLPGQSGLVPTTYNPTPAYTGYDGIVQGIGIFKIGASNIQV
jgi:hypothetical protein